MSVSTNNICSHCSELGHLIQSCPNNATNNKCFQCGELGHFIQSCPSRNNNYNKKDQDNDILSCEQVHQTLSCDSKKEIREYQNLNYHEEMFIVGNQPEYQNLNKECLWLAI